MAIKVFLGSGDTFTASNAGMSIFGGAGTQTVLLNSAATGATLDANIERVDLSGALSTYTFNTVNGLTEIMSGTTVVASFASLNQNVTLAFTDGSATLAQTGATAFTLGGQAITTSTTAAAITSTSMGTGWSTTTTSGVTGGTTGGTTTGQTFVLTTGVDYNMVGGSGNDTFIADNSTALNSTTSLADNLNGGGGTNTLKLYLQTGATSVGTNFPTMTSIQNLYVYGGNTGITATGALDTSAQGFTAVQHDYAPVGTALTYTLKGQSLTLSNTALAAVDVIASATDTTENITLSNVAGTGASGLNFNSANITSATITSSGTSANTINAITNTGAALATLNISGTQGFTTSTALTTLATVNASGNSGGVTFTDTAVVPAAFAFTGGSGNDTLNVKAGTFGVLTSGSQLDGGAGTDTLVTNETAVLTAAQVTSINATKNFETLGFGASGSGVDVSTLTTLNKFSVASGNFTESFSNANNSSTFYIDNTTGNTGTITVADKVGQTTTSITLDTTTATATKALAALTLTGDTVVNLTSQGSSGNVITTLTNADNTAFTITGSAPLTMSLVATKIGSSINGVAASGALTLTGNTAAFSAGSSLGDTLIGGSAADTLKAAINGGTLTGNGGNDTFDVSVAKGGTSAGYNVTTITDFTKGDILKFAAVGTTVWNTTKVNISGAASEAAALDALSTGAGNVNGIVSWGNYGGNTYVVYDAGAGATFAATDVMVKLTGTLDLSTSTASTAAGSTTITFA